MSAVPVLLVVDDEALNRDLLRRLLSPHYRVLEAPDARSALVLLEAQAPPVDLLLCDQQMPGQSGTELAAVVRARWPHIVALLVTGYDEAPEVLAARETGTVHQVIAKPWAARALKAAIAAAIAGRGKREP